MEADVSQVNDTYRIPEPSLPPSSFTVLLLCVVKTLSHGQVGKLLSFYISELKYLKPQYLTCLPAANSFPLMDVALTEV